MKVEQSTQMGVDDLDDRCRRATQILVTHDTKRKYPDSFDAINAEPITPTPPQTRNDATPHILLVGPFQAEPDLYAVAIYVGIGIIEIHDIDRGHCTYGFRAIGGEGIEARDAYLLTAFRLYFNDVTILQKATT